jgi:phenylalanyl-tRNA synthetase beta chain
VDYPDSTQELAHRVTMAGLEVDAVEPAAPAFEGVVVGEIVACEPHPDADKLKLCQVAAGAEQPLPVVCGAPNARVGLKAPFAMVGAVLPGDMRIRKAKLRGQTSHGMLCSARELGLSDDAAGLMELAPDAPVGGDLRDYLGLDDQIIEVDLTPNRGDCLGMAGVAREVGVLARKPVGGPVIDPVPAACDDRISVELRSAPDCPRYLGRIVRGVDAGAPTPTWMRERLRRAGVRPLSCVVDVTNYVMLELGQPMHAFDRARIEGGIVVRRAEAGESLELLNGDTVELDAQTLVIADHARPLAMAGVMGGEQSAVGDDTRDILLEAAFFAPTAIAGRARAYGLHTDSSHRFERGVDPALPARAMERATRLLLDIAGGTPGPVVEAVEPAHLPAAAEVELRPGRVAALLGAELPEAEIRDILTRLGMTVEARDGVWSVAVPSWRFDISREVDLIEEIARIHGYDALPAARSPVRLAMGERPERQRPLRRLRNLLVDRGYQEAVSYSFVAPELQAALDPDADPLPLANPISADLAVMRTSLWPGLVRAAVYNQNRQNPRLRLFESGQCFRGTLDALGQRPMIGGIATGTAAPEGWAADGRAVDFFDVKGDVEALLALTGEAERFRFVAERHPALHPGQSARIYREDEPAGWLGAVYPATARQLDLAGPAYVFELDLAIVCSARLPAFTELSRFPSIRRDLAIVVDERVTADAVRACIAAAAGPLLRELLVFDVYQGKGVAEGRKSLAIGLILQESSRTLADEDVERIIRLVVDRLRQDLDAALRE